MSWRFGVRGSRGNAGSAGAAGAKGDTGDTGATGPQGDFNYTDRGDPDAVDFTESDFTKDSTWRDLDISGIVGAAQRLVLIQCNVQVNGVAKGFNLREKGNSLAYNIGGWISPVANVLFTYDRWVLTDASGVIQYYAETATWTYISLIIRGWVAPTA